MYTWLNHPFGMVNQVYKPLENIKYASNSLRIR